MLKTKENYVWKKSRITPLRRHDWSTVKAETEKNKRINTYLNEN